MSFSKDYLYPFKELMAIMRRLDRPLYMIASETEVSDPKCPYCDENRMITLTAPNGQSMTVPCKCGENKHKVYYVIPCRVLDVKIDEMSVELRYDYGTRKYVRRHDSIVDPEPDDKRLKSTNYISLSFTTIEKAVAFIERQGWIYSQEHTEDAMRKAERGFKAEVKEKLRPSTPDEKLRKKYAKKGIVVEGAFHDTDPDPETYIAETMAEGQSSMPSDLPSEEIGTDEEYRVGEEYRTDTEDDGSWWD